MTYIIGVDPGPLVGIAGLWVEGQRIERAEVAQCTDYAIMRVLRGLCPHAGAVLAAERFVVGPRAGRSAAPGAARAARGQLALIREWATLAHITYVEHTAAQVMPWATDARLTRAGLFVATKGMRHARDAARHALFVAVHDCGLSDPLSKRGAI